MLTASLLLILATASFFPASLAQQNMSPAQQRRWQMQQQWMQQQQWLQQQWLQQQWMQQQQQRPPQQQQRPPQQPQQQRPPQQPQQQRPPQQPQVAAADNTDGGNPTPNAPATPPAAPANNAPWSNVWASTLLPNPAQCERVVQRKEVRDLTPAEWRAFVNAVKQLQGSTVYDRLVKIHIDYQTPIHNWATFLPWHRYYVRQFEMHLQRIDPSIAVPYWNWAFDAQAPEASVVLSDQYYGGRGVGQGNCVADGVFKDWRPYYPRGRHCMRRDFDLTEALSAWYGPEPINAAITSSNTYDAFRRAIEYPIHAAVHTNIGSDMASMASPNDPLFFAHHAYVDKLYTEWQQAHPRLAMTYNGPNADGSQAAPTDRLAPWSITHAEVLDTRALCYTYAEMSPVHTPRARTVTPQPADDLVQQQGAPVNTAQWEFLVRRSYHEEPTAPHGADGAHDNRELHHIVHVPRPPRHQPHPTCRKGVKHVFTEVPSSYEEPADAPKPAPCRLGEVDYNLPLPDYSRPDASPSDVSYADRQNLLAVRTPRPLPESWIRMNHIDETELRARESEYAAVCRHVNSIPTYVSPTALYSRPDMLETLAPKVKNFYAVADGTRVVPAAGGYGRGERSVYDVVSSVRRVVQEKCASKVYAPATTFAETLAQVIGRVVQPVISTAYPVLHDTEHHPSPYDGGVKGHVEYSDADDEVCDAAYDVPPTYTPVPPVKTGLRPEHAIRAPRPVQTGVYKKRVADKAAYLADGGDAYDNPSAY